MSVASRALSLGEEFTDFILVDDKRDSIIINIKECYFKIIFTEYRRLGYSLKHVTRFKNDELMTCVFAKDV